MHSLRMKSGIRNAGEDQKSPTITILSGTRGNTLTARMEMPVNVF